jgi:hypothetical protein
LDDLKRSYRYEQEKQNCQGIKSDFLHRAETLEGVGVASNSGDSRAFPTHRVSNCGASIRAMNPRAVSVTRNLEEVRSSMFTVKFYAEPLPDSDRSEGGIFIVEAEEVDVLPTDTGYIVSAIHVGNSLQRLVRYKTEEERAGRVDFPIGCEPYWRAIIENSAGKTTEIITAPQKDPPSMAKPRVAA